MQFKSEINVINARPQVFEIDGKKFDSTKIKYLVEMNKNVEGIGFDVAEVAWGDSTNYTKVKSQVPPFAAIATFEQVSNGKTTSLVLLDLVPVATTPEIKK